MQAEQSDAKPRKNYWIATLLILVIFVLPLGSYWYLHSGLEYQKEALSELDSLGMLPAFDYRDQAGSRVDTSHTQNRVMLASFFDLHNEQTEARIHNMKAIHNQFDNRKDVLFVSFYTGSQEENPEALAERLGIRDVDQWKLIHLPQEEYARMLQTFALTEETRQSISLVDIRGVIRRAYAVDENRSMGRLIEHTAMLIPARESRKAELRREKEK